MKKIVILVLFVFIIKTDGMAQSGQQPGAWMAGSHHFIMQHSNDLELTDDQKKELLAITIERRSERRIDRPQNRRDGRAAVRGSRQYNQRGNGEWSGRQGLYFENRMAVQERISEILSAEQLEKLEAIRAERINRMNEIRTLRHEVMIEKAGLEGEKAAKVKELLDNHAQNRPAWSGDADREAMLQFRSERQERMTELHNDLKQLLTAAEYEQLQTYMVQGRSAGWGRDRQRSPGLRSGRR